MESFDRLAKQYEPMIHKIIHSLHIFKNKEEFFQHGLIALWEAGKRFDPDKGNFTNYAYTYLKGYMLMELKKSIKEEERNICPPEEFWDYIVDPATDFLQVSAVLFDHVPTLTENQRKWLVYTVIQGLSIKELAEQEHVSISAVKSWRDGARAKLRGNLKM